MSKTLYLFGFDFCNASSVQEVAVEVFNTETHTIHRLPLMVTPNVDQLVKLARPEHAELREALSNAQWILPDGQPIVAVSKMKYGSKVGLPARLAGSDFFPAIWSMLLEQAAIKVMFVLPDSDLGEKFMLQRENVNYYAPPFFDQNDHEIFDAVKRKVNEQFQKFEPEYIFIGLGFPKQERIALDLLSTLMEHKQRLPKVFLLGASFEFYWGTKKRAPLIWQKLGMEFVHRLISEPKRMAKRYLVDDLAFLPMAIRELRKSRSES